MNSSHPSHYLPDNLKAHTKAMMFVDGENLTIRYKNKLGNDTPMDHVKYLENIYVWSNFANIINHINCEVIRKYYYTSVQGDEPKSEEIKLKLKEIGIEAPQVFNKKRNRQTKKVDITLSTDMLTHAHRGNYDLAILVAGDGDYVPLVHAIKNEGCRVVLWFFGRDNGLSNNLLMESDYYFDISWFLFNPYDKISKYSNV